MLGTAFAYIALTFFMVRISFAAAMAAGDAGFSCDCGAGCARAGSPENARPNPSPAAIMTVERSFIRFSSIAVLWPFKNANSVGASQHRHARKTNEQPVLDDARNRVQQAGQAGSVGYQPEMGIDYPVATIGDKSMAVSAISDTHLPGSATCREPLPHCPPRRREPKRNDLDRQREAAESRDPFRIVGDHNHAIRRGSDDFFAQQRSAAALDQIERRVNLVRAINCEIEPVEFIEGRQGNAAALRVGARRLRGRHADHIESASHPLAKKLNEMPRGRAGPETELHAVANVF